MKLASSQVLFWTPRALGALLGLFVGVFALDVFTQGRSAAETFLAFLIHLIPAAIVFAALAIAWRWELTGGILFLGLAFLYVAMTGGTQHWAAYLVLAGVPALVGILFLLDWRHRAGLKAHA